MAFKKLAFMASGSGTNFENIVREIHSGRLQAQASVLLCDKPGAGVLDRARRLGVPAALIDRKDFASKAEFEDALTKRIESAEADFIVLAGYMRILSADFVRRFWGRILNIHPSLLPAFPGAHGIRDAYEAGAAVTGVTVHFVDTGVDTGPIILQQSVPRLPEDTLETLETRVHAAEYELYPRALQLLAAGQVRIPPRA